MISSTELIEQLKYHRRLYVMLGNTSQARTQALELARQIGSTAYLSVLPAAINNANDWLVKQPVTAKQVQAVLNAAQSLFEAEVSDLRAQVRELLIIPEDKMGTAQWVGHIMKRLQLTDRTRPV